MKNLEVEVVYTGIDVSDIENRLQSVGAKKVEDILYKIAIFDYPDLAMERKYSWVRLRARGEKITLTYKERLGVNEGNGEREDLGMKEVEIVVNSFEQTKEFLLNIGLIVKLEQDKKRKRWQKKRCGV